MAHIEADKMYYKVVMLSIFYEYNAIVHNPLIKHFDKLVFDICFSVWWPTPTSANKVFDIWEVLVWNNHLQLEAEDRYYKFLTKTFLQISYKISAY